MTGYIEPDDSNYAEKLTAEDDATACYSFNQFHLGPAFKTFCKKTFGVDSLIDLRKRFSQMSLEEKMKILYQDNTYLKFLDLFERDFKTKILRNETHLTHAFIPPNFRGQFNFNEISPDHGWADLSEFIIHAFYIACALSLEQMSAFRKLSKKNVSYADFSAGERQLLSVFFTLFQKDPKGVSAIFDYTEDAKKITTTFLLKHGLTDCASKIASTLSLDNPTLLMHSLEAFAQIDNEQVMDSEDVNKIKVQIDEWLSTRLNTKIFNAPFRTYLTLYLQNAPLQANKVFSLYLPYFNQLEDYLQDNIWTAFESKIAKDPEAYSDTIKLYLPHLKKFPQQLQDKIWQAFEAKTTQDPKAYSALIGGLPYVHDIPEKFHTGMYRALLGEISQNGRIVPNLAEAVNQFIDHNTSAEELISFYKVSKMMLSDETRAEILAQLSQKSLKKYWNTLIPETKEILLDKIQTGETYDVLGWYLLQQKLITPEQMMKAVEKVDPQEYKKFFFNTKKAMVPEAVFTQIANQLDARQARSVDYCWNWIDSFGNVDGFRETLARIYPNFSDQIRGDLFYTANLNARFDLVYHLAKLGDTKSLALFNKKLETGKFWSFLSQEHEDHTSGLTELCRKNKMEVLHWAGGLSEQDKSKFFLEPNSQGQSVYDLCSGAFKNALDEKLFGNNNEEAKQQVILKEEEHLEPVPEMPKAMPIQTSKQSPVSLRPVLQPKGYAKELNDYKKNKGKDNKNVDVEQYIHNLQGMNSAAFSQALQQDTGRSFDRAKYTIRTHCFNQHHLGYTVVGDIIIPLFLLPHSEYVKRYYGNANGLSQWLNRADEALSSAASKVSKRSEGR